MYIGIAEGTVLEEVSCQDKLQPSKWLSALAHKPCKGLQHCKHLCTHHGDLIDDDHLAAQDSATAKAQLPSCQNYLILCVLLPRQFWSRAYNCRLGFEAQTVSTAE